MDAPTGYSVPRLAADLMAHATSQGWVSKALWTHGPGVSEPFLRVQVGRLLLASEALPVDAVDPYATVRGDRWVYSVTWHSRGCAPGKLQLFRRALASTPWVPAMHDGPSVKGIREVIARHPGPDQRLHP